MNKKTITIYIIIAACYSASHYCHAAKIPSAVSKEQNEEYLKHKNIFEQYGIIDPALYLLQNNPTLQQNIDSLNNFVLEAQQGSINDINTLQQALTLINKVRNDIQNIEKPAWLNEQRAYKEFDDYIKKMIAYLQSIQNPTAQSIELLPEDLLTNSALVKDHATIFKESYPTTIIQFKGLDQKKTSFMTQCGHFSILNNDLLNRSLHNKSILKLLTDENTLYDFYNKGIDCKRYFMSGRSDIETLESDIEKLHKNMVISIEPKQITILDSPMQLTSEYISTLESYKDPSNEYENILSKLITLRCNFQCDDSFVHSFILGDENPKEPHWFAALLIRANGKAQLWVVDTLPYNDHIHNKRLRAGLEALITFFHES